MLAVMPLSFERPEWLWLLLIVPVAIAGPLIARSLSALPAGRRWFALSVRAGLLAALILAIAGAQSVRESQDLAVIFLLDRSRSIPKTLQQAQERFVRQVGMSSKRPHNDKTAVISFDGKSNIEQLPMRGVFVERVTQPVEPDRTDLSQAVRLALATFPEGMAKRIVLLSDGNQNAGNLLGEAAEAASNAVAIDVVPLEYEHDREVMLDRLVAPAQANLDERVPVRIVLRSKRPTTGKLVLYHDGHRVGAEPVELKAGVNPFVRELLMSGARVHRLEARFEPDDPGMDEIVENNVARAFTFVQGEGAVLLLTTEVGSDEAITSALSEEKVKVEMTSMDDAPEDVLDMLDYDAIILSNVPADSFTEDQKKQLAAYVRDMGGGLVMTGGNEGFGAGGWLDSPVEEVMPVKFDVKQRRQIPRGALVLIMHTCEMARANFWSEQIAIAAVQTISTLDYVGLIAYGFSGGTRWEIPFQVAKAKQRIIDRIRQISGRIGDMPDFGKGMEMAYAQLSRTADAGQKHIIIISDGDATPPARSITQKLKRAGITCSTVAIGFGAHVEERTMKWIAKATGGRYHRVNNPRKLPQILTKEAKVVRRALIREVKEGLKPRLRMSMPEVTRGVADAELPLLTGYVVTTPRTAANEFSRLLMVTDQEDPLLAVRQCELGRTVAFTSGWWTHWGTQWVNWAKFGKLWAQAIRWAMRQGQASEFEVSTRLVGDEGHIVVEAVDTEASFLNGLNVGGKVLTPDATGKPIRLHQTGPGRYEGRFPATANGHYVALLSYTTPKGNQGIIKTGLSVSYSPEYRELTSNEALLHQVAEKTGGKVLTLDPEKADVYRRPVAPSIDRRPIWQWLLAWFVIPLLLLGVAGRRLASTIAISICIEVVIAVWILGAFEWYRHVWGWPLAVVLAEAVGWAIRWRSIPRVMEAVAAELRGQRAAEAAAESVSRLKGIRERVREEMSERAAQEPSAPDGAPSDAGAPVDASARFDLGGTGDQTVGDLDQAVGGARTHEAEPPRGAAPSEEEPTDAESTTSRLLEARRRAKKDQDEK